MTMPLHRHAGKNLRFARRVAQDNCCFYLGRRLVLRIASAERERIVVERQWLSIETRYAHKPDRVRTLVRHWMRERACDVLPKRFAAVAPIAAQLGLSPLQLTVRAMKRQWATHSPCGRRIALNVMLIEVPQPCVDYVIANEMCRISATGPCEQYFVLLSKHVPNWQRQRDVLAGFGRSASLFGATGGGNNLLRC